MSRIVLQFSGGKDSLACLYLSRSLWEDENFHVVWLNSGAADEATVASVERVRGLVRNFHEVAGRQREVIEQRGIPADVVPWRYTVDAVLYAGQRPPYLIQSGLACCAASIWVPLHEATLALGARFIVRGQRLQEKHVSPLRNGDVVDGVTYLYPIEDWTDDEVFAYLKAQGAEIPSYYGAEETTSRDCWDCTAYMDLQASHVRRLSGERRALVEQRMDMIRRAVRAEMGEAA